MVLSSYNPDQKPGVVVVNCDKTQQMFLCELLQTSGMKAAAYDDAESALTALISESPPAAIVVDLHLPGIDGVRFCRLLRSPEFSTLNRVPVLVTSAIFTGEFPARALTDAEANDFLTLPVDGKLFIQHVKALLDGKKLQPGLKVWIVEGEPQLSDSLLKAFQTRGYLAEAAFTYQDAVAKISPTTCDILILDHDLPDGSPDELLKIIHEKNSDCLCVVITSTVQPGLALHWMKMGVSALLYKPFAPEYLIAQCEQACREHALLRVQKLLEIRTHQLKTSEENFRNLIQNSSSPIFAFNPDETYRFVNTAFAQAFGKKPDEIIGKTPHAVFPYDEAEKRLTLIRKIFKTGEKGEIEGKVITHTGEERYFLTMADPVKDEHGNVLYITCTSKDTTERVHSEIALRESEARYRAFFEQGPDGVVILNTDTGQILEFNDQACRQLGYTREEFCKLNVADIDVIESVEDVQARINKVLATGRDDFETLHRTRNGGVRNVHVTAQVIDSGKHPIYHCIWRDITEQKKAQDELWKSEAQKKAILNGIGINIALVDPDLNILWVNNASARSIHKTPEEMIGHPCYSFWGDSIHPCENCPTVRAFQTQKSERAIIQSPNGKIWDEGGEPVTDLHGNVIAVVEIAQDITERKHAEDTIDEQLLELRRWQKITMGREERILELKREVNRLLSAAGKTPRYNSAQDNVNE